MAKPISDDQLRNWVALGFTAAEMAQLARPLPEADIVRRLAALSAKEQQAEQQRQAAQDAQTQRIARDQARAALAASQRPLPSDDLLKEPVDPLFEPALELAGWVEVTFLKKTGPLYNKDHSHLLDAHIGFLWTNVPNQRSGNRIIGQAERPQAQGGRWAKAKLEYQMRAWFGEMPDFLITLDAHYAAGVADLEFCATVEHELYHCAQAVNEYGARRWSKQTGKPIFTMKGHDVEEFVAIVRLYGAEAGAGQTQALIAAASRPPVHGAVHIATACGTCLR